MERSRLLNTLLVLLIIIAVLVLAQMLWQILSGFSDIILLFILGWILSFALDPLVDDLQRNPFPYALLPAARLAIGSEQAEKLNKLRLSRTAAVIVVYLGLLVAVIIFVALLVPPTVAQLTQIAGHLPEYMSQMPEVSIRTQEQLANAGIQVDIQDAVKNAMNSLQGAATSIVQNALGLFTGLLGFLANLFLVLILSFYISLEGGAVRDRALGFVPPSFQVEANYLSQSVNRTFGGFIRGQIVQAILQGLGTAVAMTVLGLNFVLAASLFATLFMLIPLVGPVLALIPPIFAVLFQAPELALWLLIALFVYQTIIVNVLMPRVLSKAIGLHPLLVFAAILVGIKIGGFWGAFFGIPVAGVVWAMFEYLLDKWQRGEHAREEVSKAPEESELRPAESKRTVTPEWETVKK